MRKIRLSHIVVGALLLAGLLVTGSVTASNMAFKINMTFHRSPNCSACDTWTSFPFDNRFRGQNIRLFCDSNGDGVVSATTDLIAFVSQQGRFDPGPIHNPAALDATITHSCTGPIGVNNPPYIFTRGVRIRPKTGAGDLQVVYVGADIPGTQILYRKSRLATPPGSGVCTTCDNQTDMVLHTTYRTLRDACDSNGDGLVSTADEIAFVTQQRSLSLTTAIDSTVTHSCTGPVTVNNPAMIIGRGIRVRLKTTAAGDVLVRQPHF